MTIQVELKQHTAFARGGALAIMECGRLRVVEQIESRKYFFGRLNWADLMGAEGELRVWVSCSQGPLGAGGAR